MIKIFYCIILLVIAFSPSILLASNSTACLQSCYLDVQNSEIIHLEFIRTLNEGTTRVVYFDIANNHYYNDNATLYAWIRDSVGEPMFSLPIDYIAVALNLPGAFIHYQLINFTESTPGCYKQSSSFCQKILIMSALVNITGLNNRCSGTNCGSLCRRHFSFYEGDIEPDFYSCCSEKSLEKHIDLAECLQPNRLPPYISILTTFTIILAALLSLSTVIKISERVAKYLGR